MNHVMTKVKLQKWDFQYIPQRVQLKMCYKSKVACKINSYTTGMQNLPFRCDASRFA